jgi:uncharacterized protein YndB with AHSA1/START domain
MSDSPAIAAHGAVVKKILLLNSSRDHAFKVFTQNMGRWWPATHHVGNLPFRDILMEPRVGGRWYEINVHDEEGLWGYVLAWEPTHRVVLSWHLDTTFKFNADLARASELHLTFHALADSKVRVELEHRHIERHGEGHEGLRDMLDGGWVGVLGDFAKFADPTATGVLADAPAQASA